MSTEKTFDHSDLTEEEKKRKGIETEEETAARLAVQSIKSAKKPKKEKKAKMSKPSKPSKPKASSKEKKQPKPKKESERAYTRHKGTKDDPLTGQSAPKLGNLDVRPLNEKEKAIMTALKRSGSELSIATLAERVLSQNNVKEHGTSHVRNSLRRLVRERLVKKTGKGTYKAA